MNKPADGRVEMQGSGQTKQVDEVEAFIGAIAESELKSHIRKVDVSVIPPPAGFHGFGIRQ